MSKITIDVGLYGVSFIIASFVALHTGSLWWGIATLLVTVALLTLLTLVFMAFYLRYQMCKFTKEMEKIVTMMDNDHTESISDSLNEWSEENEA